jgi:hypothetical protein
MKSNLQNRHAVNIFSESIESDPNTAARESELADSAGDEWINEKWRMAA